MAQTCFRSARPRMQTRAPYSHSGGAPPSNEDPLVSAYAPILLRRVSRKRGRVAQLRRPEFKTPTRRVRVTEFPAPLRLLRSYQGELVYAMCGMPGFAIAFARPAASRTPRCLFQSYNAVGPGATRTPGFPCSARSRKSNRSARRANNTNEIPGSPERPASPPRSRTQYSMSAYPLRVCFPGAGVRRLFRAPYSHASHLLTRNCVDDFSRLMMESPAVTFSLIWGATARCLRALQSAAGYALFWGRCVGGGGFGEMRRPRSAPTGARGARRRRSSERFGALRCALGRYS